MTRLRQEASPGAGPTIPLLDGALSQTPATTRDQKIKAMAADLVEYNAYGDERAAIRTLSGRGYGQGDIVTLLDAARRVAEMFVANATQARVSAEMTKP